MINQNSDEEFEWGSGGEYRDGWGPGFGEKDDSDGYDQNKEDIKFQELTILESFETLGLDPRNELTMNQLKRAYCLLIIRSLPDQAPPDELSQKKAKELSQRINGPKISWKSISITCLQH